LVGVLTDRDLAIRAIAQGLDPKKTHVRDVMTPEPLTVGRDERIETAAALMESHALRRLVVVDDWQRPAGILAVEDLSLFPETAPLAIAILRRLYGARSVELDGAIP
jgi:CBS domain-containing protein